MLGQGVRDEVSRVPGAQRGAQAQRVAVARLPREFGEQVPPLRRQQGREAAQRVPRLSQMWTMGQVSVRVIPGTDWILATTSLPRSSTFSASARTITS